jgi:PadR family transcriptional regulator, regulatory protein PadR
MLSKELVAASTKPIVLSVLMRGETYGYALIQQVRELSGGSIDWTEGMLYPVLHRMEKEGIIVSEWKDAPTGPKRKYYAIAPAGKRELARGKQEWINLNAVLTNLWKSKPIST